MTKLFAGSLALVLVAGMTGTAFAQTIPGIAVDEVTGLPAIKVDVCHQGMTINIAQAAVPAHVPGHPGDTLGACEPNSDFDGDLVPFGDDPDDNDPCNPNPNAVACLSEEEDDHAVAGELLSIDSSALVIGGLTSSAVWMIPTLAGIAGAGIYLIKLRTNRD